MAVQFKKSIDAEVKSTTIPKYAGIKDGKDIVSIVSDEHTWVLQTHYIEGYGSFHCFKGQCCLDYPKVNVAYIYPLIKYKMTGQGLDYTKPVEFMYLKASKDLYSQIAMYEQTGGVLPETDFLFHCTDPGFQKIKLADIKNKTGSKWKNDPELVAKVKEFIASYEVLIEGAVKIKPMDAQKYANLYDSPEFLKSQEAFGQRMQQQALSSGQQQQGGYNRQPQQQIAAPVQQVASTVPTPEIVIDEADFDALVDI